VYILVISLIALSLFTDVHFISAFNIMTVSRFSVACNKLKFHLRLQLLCYRLVFDQQRRLSQVQYQRGSQFIMNEGSNG
jgi:hypothetical protein